MSQSISRRSFLKCAGSGAVSLAAALLTGVCAAAQQPCLAGEPALLDGKAAVELLGTALTSVTIRDDCRLDMNVFPDTVEVNYAEG